MSIDNEKIIEFADNTYAQAIVLVDANGAPLDIGGASSNVSGLLTQPQLNSSLAPINTTLANISAQVETVNLTISNKKLTDGEVKNLTIAPNQSVAITTKPRTPKLTRANADGSVTAGAQSVAIANSGLASCTVLGAILKAGESVTWQSNNADTLGAIDYAIPVGGELLISEVR